MIDPAPELLGAHLRLGRIDADRGHAPGQFLFGQAGERESSGGIRPLRVRGRAGRPRSPLRGLAEFRTQARLPLPSRQIPAKLGRSLGGGSSMQSYSDPTAVMQMMGPILIVMCIVVAFWIF